MEETMTDTLPEVKTRIGALWSLANERILKPDWETEAAKPTADTLPEAAPAPA